MSGATNASSASTSAPQMQWEAANSVETVESLYEYDQRQHKDLLDAKPWVKDTHYFKNVKISTLALLKMLMHCRSGGQYEVMGMMLGKCDGATMVVLDSFALPVEGTETRVSAHAEANEYMMQYLDLIKESGRSENCIGWYHSHPGYGCWLSGIDCSTQMLQQKYQEPFLAVVIDPVQTLSAGKVSLGAFRTYPEGYKSEDSGSQQFQHIPLNKIEDFGVHSNQYYSLDVSYFKSSLDQKLLSTLWNRYWSQTLSSSALLSNSSYITAQCSDIAGKLQAAGSSWARPDFGMIATTSDATTRLGKLCKESEKLGDEVQSGALGEVVKQRIFNFVDVPLSSATHSS